MKIDNKNYVSPWSSAIRDCNVLDEYTNSLPSNIFNYFIPKIFIDSM